MLVATDSSDRENCAEALNTQTKQTKKNAKIGFNRIPNEPVTCIKFKFTIKKLFETVCLSV